MMRQSHLIRYFWKEKLCFSCVILKIIVRCLPSPIVLRNKEQVAQWTSGKNRIKIGILLLLSLTHSLTHSFWRYMWPRLLYGTVTTKTSENLFLPTLQHPLFPEDGEELCKESFKFRYHYCFMLVHVKEYHKITAKIVIKEKIANCLL